MVQFGVSLVSIIIELIQLSVSEEFQFVLKVLIVFCLLGKKGDDDDLLIICVAPQLYIQCKWHIHSVLIDTYAFIKNPIPWKWIA